MEKHFNEINFINIYKEHFNYLKDLIDNLSLETLEFKKEYLKENSTYPDKYKELNYYASNIKDDLMIEILDFDQTKLPNIPDYE